jgi:hypothetical protein
MYFGSLCSFLVFHAPLATSREESVKVSVAEKKVNIFCTWSSSMRHYSPSLLYLSFCIRAWQVAFSRRPMP